MPKAQLKYVRNFTNAPSEGKPILFKHFYDLKNVYLQREEPRRTVLTYSRDSARFLGLWPDQQALKARFYKFYTFIVVSILTVFWSTIAGDLYTAGNDVVLLGESIMFLMGVSIIYFKTLLSLKNWTNINEIIEMISELHSRTAALKNSSIKKMQRIYFIAEVGVSIFFHNMAFFLFVTLSVQPLLTRQATPLPALFPFNLQQFEIHPWGSIFVYIFQVFAIFHSLLLILSIDTLGVCTITQTSLNLRILSIQLRELGLKRHENFDMLNELRDLVKFHQKIIAINEKANCAFYGTYILQMFTSTLMLGVAGFETLYAKDKPMVAFKFLFFMCVVALQLLYWCMIGNMVFFDSQDVAVAAFEAHEWFDQSAILQRNLMFVIFRAQKPLVFRAKPLMPFTFETFSRIIRTSYTSFTLLCNTSE